VLDELGEKGFLSTRAAALGLCLALQGRSEEVEPFLELAMEVMPADGVDVLNLIHMARSVTLLSEGSLDEAEEHARKALASIADWDHPNFKGDSLVLLADILHAAGRQDEAITAYSEALALYEEKENLVAAGRVERAVEALRAGATA
jgi:tetratricopeptide (TPR) repeat protein